MSKLGTVYQAITELYNNGVENERIAEITKTSTQFVESVILSEMEKNEQKMLIEIENNKGHII